MPSELLSRWMNVSRLLQAVGSAMVCDIIENRSGMWACYKDMRYSTSAKVRIWHGGLSVVIHPSWRTKCRYALVVSPRRVCQFPEMTSSNRTYVVMMCPVRSL